MKWLFTAVLAALLWSCTAQHRVNGFYRISDYPDNQIMGDAIVTAEDFEHASLDSMCGEGLLWIDLRLKPEKMKLFADATEAAIGHRIGFVYNDSVIMAPKVNTRIDGGRSQITSPDTALVREIYEYFNKIKH